MLACEYHPLPPSPVIRVKEFVAGPISFVRATGAHEIEHIDTRTIRWQSLKNKNTHSIYRIRWLVRKYHLAKSKNIKPVAWLALPEDVQACG